MNSRHLRESGDIYTYCVKDYMASQPKGMNRTHTIKKRSRKVWALMKELGQDFIFFNIKTIVQKDEEPVYTVIQLRI